MKQLLLLIMLLCSSTVFAQDVIVKKDGSTILSKVLEVNQDEIKYKIFSNLDGPTYTIRRVLVQAINYQNGMRDTFSGYVQEENKYQPNNQSDGARQMNDNALLALASSIDYPKKIKNLRTFGIIGGVVMVGGGITALILNGGNERQSDIVICYILGGVGIVGGITCTTLCLMKAKQLENEMRLQKYSLLRKEFKLANGTKLVSGIDLIKDRVYNKRTLGLSIHYNF